MLITLVKGVAARVALVSEMPLALHAAAATGAFAALQGAQAVLNASYAASGFPVDYRTGQLAFSAERIEGYYAVMAGQGTLDVYLRTQMIDFGFIAAVAATGLLLPSLVARLGPAGGITRRVGLGLSLLAVTGAGFDALENLISFVMLARPEVIAAPVALAYSSAAAAKFACLMPATTLFFALPLLAAGEALRRRMARRSAVA